MVSGLRYFIESVVARGDLAKDKKEKKMIKEGAREVFESLLLQKGKSGVEDEDEGGLTSGSDFD